MTIDSTTGAVSWLPDALDLGRHELELTATDGRGGTATQSFVLEVTPAAPANREPVIVSAPLTEFNLQSDPIPVYTLSVLAVDADGDTLTFSLTTSPVDMTIDSSTGAISWPVGVTDVGTHPVTAEVSDGNGGTDTQSFTLEIFDVTPVTVSGTVYRDTNGNSVQDTGEIGLGGIGVFVDTNDNGRRDAGEPLVNTGVDGQYTLDGLLPGITYSIVQQPQTGFTVVSPADNRIQVSSSGAPITDIDFGNQDNGQTENGAPQITSSPLTQAKVNQAYSYTALATDPDGDPLTFTFAFCSQWHGRRSGAGRCHLGHLRQINSTRIRYYSKLPMVKVASMCSRSRLASRPNSNRLSLRASRC